MLGLVLAGGAFLLAAIVDAKTEPKPVVVRKPVLTVVPDLNDSNSDGPAPESDEPEIEDAPRTASKAVRKVPMIVMTTVAGAGIGALYGYSSTFNAIGALGVGIGVGTSMTIFGLMAGTIVGLTLGIGLMLGSLAQRE